MAKPFKSWAHSVRDLYLGNSDMPALEAAGLHTKAHDGYNAYGTRLPLLLRLGRADLLQALLPGPLGTAVKVAGAVAVIMRVTAAVRP